MAVIGAVSLIPMMASSWVNVALYAVELVLCGQYFARPFRPLINKIGLGIMVLADTFCTISICFKVSMAVVPTEERYRFVVGLAVQIITTYITAAITQLSFCNLYYILTGNKLVAGILTILIFVHLGFSWASGILLLRLPRLGPESGLAFKINIAGAATCVAADVFLAVFLGWQFYQMMQDTIPMTRSMVRRILILCVGSGALCAANTLVMLILLLKGSPVFNLLGTIQGRVYALSILANFLLGIPGRRSGRIPTLSFGPRTSVSSVVFRSTSAPTGSAQNASKLTPDRGTSASTSTLPTNDHRDEVVQLDELGLGSIQSKVDS
ncbi:hypothetical protein DFH08DRAFT_945425 [Mycena albidolilacea]|uniref:DUF6534 domain-containing protein n=1 Tax=Mycena albidolilacea TaxID=1033008 RepID=A0AAD6Z0M4_9AGAR|nr:hypothetical protein DFH08DRAFT_945425 [Mycena albidolilacea]